MKMMTPLNRVGGVRSQGLRLVSHQSLDRENQPPLKPFSAVPKVKLSKIVWDLWKLEKSPYALNYYLSDLFKSQMNDEGVAVLEGGPLKPPLVLVSKPELAEEFLRASGSRPARPGFLGIHVKRTQDAAKGGYQKRGLLSTKGEEWWDFRQKVQQPMLRPKALHPYTPKIEGIAQEFVDNIVIPRLDPITGETPDDFLSDLYKWALESVTYLALDTRLGCLDPNLDKNSEQRKMIQATEVIVQATTEIDFTDPGLIAYFPYMSKPYRSLSKAHDNVVSATKGHIREAMKRCKASSHSQRDEVPMLTLFAENGCDEEVATVMAMDMMLAGIDTSSYTVAYIMYHLATNPRVQDTLFQEIQISLPRQGESLDNAKLEKMSYLRAVLKESQRIMPIVPNTARVLGPDFNLAGYSFDRECWFIALHQFMSQSDKFISDPTEYRPERFLRGHSLKEEIHPFVMMPFGHGPRMCIGRRFAEQEIKTFICKMVQNFKIEWKHKELGYIPGILNKPDAPLKFTLTPR